MIIFIVTVAPFKIYFHCHFCWCFRFLCFF